MDVGLRMFCFNKGTFRFVFGDHYKKHAGRGRLFLQSVGNALMRYLYSIGIHIIAVPDPNDFPDDSFPQEVLCKKSR